MSFQVAAQSLDDLRAIEAESVAGHAVLMEEISAQSEQAAVTLEDAESAHVGAARAALGRVEEFALEVDEAAAREAAAVAEVAASEGASRLIELEQVRHLTRTSACSSSSSCSSSCCCYCSPPPLLLLLL